MNMKTTLLSVALFLAITSFAQTNINTNATVKGKSEIKSNKVKSDVNTSSEAHIQSNTIKSKHNATAAEKSSASATANDKGKLISGIASDKSDVSVQGKEKGKLISSIASNGKSESGSIHSDIKGSANAYAKNNGHVKTHVKKIKHSGKKVKTSSANTIHTSVASAHAVKIKPVSVKTDTGIRVHIQ
jgi:hypothetical protein